MLHEMTNFCLNESSQGEVKILHNAKPVILDRVLSTFILFYKDMIIDKIKNANT